jgi:hypothetical protein
VQSDVKNATVNGLAFATFYQRRSAMSYIWIVLAILGVAALGASMTVIHGYLMSMLAIVLGGVLLQASIAAIAMHFGRERRGRRYAG